MRPLFPEPAQEYCPFNAIFLCGKKNKEEFRLSLINYNIYTSIHWNPVTNFLPESQYLAERILTIPVDQRYNNKDMHRISSRLWKS